MQRSQKQRAHLVFEYWFRTTIGNKMISNNDLIKLTLDFYNDAVILQFSEKFQSPNHHLSLSDNNKCATRNDNRSSVYEWIMPDIDPVLNGIHCWRVHVNNPSREFMMFSVSPKKMYPAKKYQGPSTLENGLLST